MVSAVSSFSQSVQYSSSTSSSDNAVQEAALEKQIQALEDQAKAAKDQVEAAKLQQQIAAAKAKLDVLKAADKAAQSGQGQSTTTSTAAARQAEFDGASSTQSTVFWM